MLAVGVHFYQLLANLIGHIARLFMQTAAAHHIARIMQRHRRLVFLDDLDAPGFEQIIVKFNGMHDVNGRHGPAQPAVAHVVYRTEGMTALAHNDLFDLQARGGFKVGALDAPHHFIVAGEHGHIAVVPAQPRRHGPVDPGHMHDHSGLVDQLGLEFGLGRNHRVHDVRTFFVQRNAQVGNLCLGLFFLPLQGVGPFIALDPHLVHGDRMAVGGVLNIQRRYAQLVNDAPHHRYQIGDVDAKRAILGAALAQVALGVGDARGLPDKVRIQFALFLDHGPQGLLDLAHRRIVRIFVVRQVVMAGIGTQPAVDAGLDIGLETGAGLAFEHACDHPLDLLGRQARAAYLDALVQYLGFFLFGRFSHLQCSL